MKGVVFGNKNVGRSVPRADAPKGPLLDTEAVARFCACCLAETLDLAPSEQRSSGGVLRKVYLCGDCRDDGALAELAQCDIKDGDAGATGTRNGNRHTTRKG